ncbi:hypothetical protein FIBSPDRAFT_949899 [Athelia psychrophila]|uniref:DUF6533 domain-containing protein n=1 Tax=Athelia psychrophila TaxID=1759441 RepID=A0A166P752_9AGAM|nr:hypothetical protein FIBSPDRAFT_949899 [Fibularhizoctonia sp. CBS 109695]
MTSSIPPAVEAELFAARQEAYIFTASFVAYAYDWLLSAPEEVELVSKRGLTWPIAIYFASRLSECLHIVITGVIILAPVGDCVAIFIATGVFSTMSIATTSYLFLLRVRAVYLQSRPITIVFGGLWLTMIALVILANASTHVAHVPGTQFCTSTDTTYFSLQSISSFVNDSLIFLAISYRLASNSATELTWRSWALSIIKGKGLYHLSRSLMKTGQLYYTAIILFFFVNLIMIKSPLVPPVMHYALVNTYIAFTNIMACKIFRGTALMDDNPTTWNTERIQAALEIHAPHRVA